MSGKNNQKQPSNQIDKLQTEIGNEIGVDSYNISNTEDSQKNFRKNVLKTNHENTKG